MKTLEAVEETLEILSQLQLNGTVKTEDGDRLSECIQQLYQLRFNLKMKDDQNV